MVKQTEKQKPTKTLKQADKETKEQEVIIDLTINDHVNKKRNQSTEIYTTILPDQNTDDNVNKNTTLCR